jgi:hypothetical protein
MRKIYFVKYYDKGSTLMAADQISAALQARGYESRSVYPADLDEIRDSILVFIKTSKLPDLVRARRRGNRRRGNRLVLDVQDTVVFKRWIKNRWLYDGLIFKNERQLRDFGSPRQLCRIVYHQWDPRYVPNTAGDRELRIAYVGLARSFRLWNRLPGVVCFDSDYFRRALDFNCHLSVREEKRDFLYKPNCKVSTAAACEANLVTTRDESTVELLGPDYPYYADATPESLLAAIDHARATLGGPEWQRGLERMRAVKERTSIDRIVDDYLEYFAELG